MRTGKVVKVISKPRGFLLAVPADPGPPPTPAEDVAYTSVDPDEYAAALVALSRGTDTDVEGVPPACTSVTVR